MKIILEVTEVTPDIYKEYSLKLIHQEESINKHIDVTLEGDYNDLKAFCFNEYSCGDTNEDIKFFFKYVKD
tara:strand:- start:382 stop:594 length:213 start_codon:yes stop_codon:yes gene_type:complete